ncbi:MAG TPA: transcriptional regulator [Bauldia sp.]|nr:transcriptional regulator [Bauldia sp.]
MTTVTLDVASREDVARRALAAFGGAAVGSRISFATPELLWKVLTARRWDILKAMAGQGPLSIRAVARRVGRDVKAVHGDVHALLSAGILDQDDDGRVVFPFDTVRVEFTLRAA